MAITETDAGSGNERLPVRVQAQHATTAEPLGDVLAEAVSVDGGHVEVVAAARTGPDGFAVLDLDPDLWGTRLMVRVAGQDGLAVTRAVLNGVDTAVLAVAGGEAVDPRELALLADHLVATRRWRPDDLAAELAAPGPDSIVRVLSAVDRARLLADLAGALREAAGDVHLVDPVALRDGDLRLMGIRDLPHDLRIGPESDPEVVTKPGVGWAVFPWALPDDQSYRDYLRSVFVLFAHQQKLGVKANPKTFPGIVERQLRRRFFQDFRTSNRTVVPLNRLLVPIVTSILTRPTGSGFGFGLAAAALPAQGTLTDRQHLDALLKLAPVSVQEFANRYRLPLTDPDSASSTPVKLNVYTLSRVLSDTAQGPLEPR